MFHGFNLSYEIIHPSDTSNYNTYYTSDGEMGWKTILIKNISNYEYNIINDFIYKTNTFTFPPNGYGSYLKYVTGTNEYGSFEFVVNLYRTKFINQFVDILDNLPARDKCVFDGPNTGLNYDKIINKMTFIHENQFIINYSDPDDLITVKQYNEKLKIHAKLLS